MSYIVVIIRAKYWLLMVILMAIAGFGSMVNVMSIK